MKTLKYLAYGVIALFGLGAVLFFNVESVQKKVFDVKADMIGSDRTVTFYTQISKEPVASYTDKDMRYEVTEGTISIWLGSKNKKVHSSMDFIIEDNK